MFFSPVLLVTYPKLFVFNLLFFIYFFLLGLVLLVLHVSHLAFLLFFFFSFLYLYMCVCRTPKEDQHLADGTIPVEN